MARRARDDLCLICLESPCTCRKVTKKAVLPKAQPKVEAAPQLERAPVKRAGLSAVRLPANKQAAPPPRTVIDNRRLEPPGRELDSLKAAVTLIVQTLGVSESSILEHRHLIELSDTELAAVQWRHRREYRNRNESSPT